MLKAKYHAIALGFNIKRKIRLQNLGKLRISVFLAENSIEESWITLLSSSPISIPLSVNLWASFFVIHSLFFISISPSQGVWITSHSSFPAKFNGCLCIYLVSHCLRRGWHTDATLDDDLPEITHLIFIIHGIGQIMYQTGGIIHSAQK